MWGNPSIKNRIMTVIKEKVAAAQDAHDKEVERLEAEHDKAVEASASKQVDSIIGKLK